MNRFKYSSLISRCILCIAAALLSCLPAHGYTITEDIIPDGVFTATPFQSSGTVVTPTFPDGSILTEVYVTLSGGGEVSQKFTTSGVHSVLGTFTLELYQGGVLLPGGTLTFSATGEGFGANVIPGFGNPTPAKYELPVSYTQAPFKVVANGSGPNAEAIVDVEVTFVAVPEPSAVFLFVMTLLLFVGCCARFRTKRVQSIA